MSMPPSPLARAPGVSLLPSLLFQAVGWLALVAACARLWVQPEAVLAASPVPLDTWTMLLAVGWVGSMVFGAGYHVLPMLAGLPLWSRRLPWLHLACHVGGGALLGLGRAGVWPQAETAGAAALLAGMVLFAFNQQVTTGRLSLWDPSSITFTLAIFWLGVSSVLFVLVQTDALSGVARAEPTEASSLLLNLGLAGFLLMALLGVAMKLVPMFVVSDRRPGLLAWVGCVLLSAGLYGLAMGELGRLSLFRTPASWAIAAGVSAYLLELGRLALTGRRRLSWELGIGAMGFFLLLPVGGWLLSTLPELGAGEPTSAVASTRLMAVLMLLGPLTWIVFGLTARLVPLAAWQIVYAPQVGRGSVPGVEALSWRTALPPLALALLLAWGYLVAGLWQNEKTGVVLAAAGLLCAALLWGVVLLPAAAAILRGPGAGAPAHLAGPGTVPAKPRVSC